MTEQEIEQLRQVIREELQGLNDVREADALRITNVEETAKTLLSISQNLITLAQSHDERVDRLAGIIGSVAKNILATISSLSAR